jgi:exodeoxyribonuclease-3
LRIVAWNCNMALRRKLDALMRLGPDLAVVAECASPERLAADGTIGAMGATPLWIGDNPNKGLAVFAWNGYRLRLADGLNPRLRFILPVHVSGPCALNLLAVWAQNASSGGIRKHQLGPLRRALTCYRGFLTGGNAVIAGDLNNNVIWHRPGWRINHANAVRIMEGYGLASAYHARSGESQGRESIPTLYWRDRRKDGPTYHIDYVFLPQRWVPRISRLALGSFEDWCGSGLSDHVPLMVELKPEPALPARSSARGKSAAGSTADDNEVRR